MDVEYKIIYSDRKKLQISVERDTSVIVRAPTGTSIEIIESSIKKKKIWIYEKTRHPQKLVKSKEKREYVSGTSILYLGKEYKLDFIDKDFEDVVFDSNFYIPQKHSLFAEELLKDWFIQKARKLITQKAEVNARRLGVTYNEILISGMRYRWGSCTPKDNLNFNWRLLKAPISVIDYVIVHELTHLVEPNHTKRFWTIISVQLPHFLKAKQWLKENGKLLETL